MVGAVGYFTLQPMARTSHKFPACGGPDGRKEAKSTVYIYWDKPLLRPRPPPSLSSPSVCHCPGGLVESAKSAKQLLAGAPFTRGC